MLRRTPTILALVLALFVADTAQAFIFRRARRARYCAPSSQYHGGGNAYQFTGSAQAVAEQKAALQARMGRMFHPGGSMGGGTYEGVGMSSAGAAAALSNCCNNGAPIIGQAAVQGANGLWYACRIYR